MKNCGDLVNTLFPFRCVNKPRPDVKARIIQPGPDPSSDQPKFISTALHGPLTAAARG